MHTNIKESYCTQFEWWRDWPRNESVMDHSVWAILQMLTTSVLVPLTHTNLNLRNGRIICVAHGTASYKMELTLKIGQLDSHDNAQNMQFYFPILPFLNSEIFEEICKWSFFSFFLILIKLICLIKFSQSYTRPKPLVFCSKYFCFSSCGWYLLNRHFFATKLQQKAAKYPSGRYTKCYILLDCILCQYLWHRIGIKILYI